MSPGNRFLHCRYPHQNPFQAESFDLFICKDLMWYVFDYLCQIISTLKCILRRDGFLYISQSFPEVESYVGKEVIKSPFHLRDIFSSSCQLVYYVIEWAFELNSRPLAYILLKNGDI